MTEKIALCPLVGKHPISAGIGEGPSNAWVSDFHALSDDKKLAFHRNEKSSKCRKFGDIDALEKWE